MKKVFDFITGSGWFAHFFSLQGQTGSIRSKIPLISSFSEELMLNCVLSAYLVLLAAALAFSVASYFRKRLHSRVRFILSGFGALFALFLVIDLMCSLSLSLRALAMAAFLLVALGSSVFLSKLRAYEWVTVAYGVAGLLAVFLPVAIPLDSGVAIFIFCGASSVLFALMLLHLALKRNYSSSARFAKILTLTALVAAVLFSIASLFSEKAIQSVYLSAATIPFLLSILFSWPRHAKLTEEELSLSDQVGKVSVALTRFIPQEFLSILDKASVADLQLGDHVKKSMTIFFSDIRHFTTLSEGLTPEENFKFVNSYLARVVPIVIEKGGFVDKYLGDGIMALFPKDGGADDAVRTGIEIQKALVEYNRHRANSGYQSLSMGIGLHTGPLMLGVVGTEDRMQSTVISDAVNLASRLESITKVFNISLAISEETFKSLQDPGAYMYRFIGKVRVKGKNEPVSVFEIFDGITPEQIDRKMKANRFFEQGMLGYYHKDFTGALYYFRKVLEILPEDGAAAFYLDNCMAKART